MVKAKDFWNYLCGELDYRFFSGVACKGLSPLYDSMKPSFMHYVPAANERIAMGLVMGARIAGLKGAVLMDMRYIHDTTSFIKLSAESNIPLLIIGSIYDGDSIINYDYPVAYIMGEDFKVDIDRVSSQAEKEKVPGLIVFDKGALE